MQGFLRHVGRNQVTTQNSTALNPEIWLEGERHPASPTNTRRIPALVSREHIAPESPNKENFPSKTQPAATVVARGYPGSIVPVVEEAIGGGHQSLAWIVTKPLGRSSSNDSVVQGVVTLGLVRDNFETSVRPSASGVDRTSAQLAHHGA